MAGPGILIYADHLIIHQLFYHAGAAWGGEASQCVYCFRVGPHPCPSPKEKGSALIRHAGPDTVSIAGWLLADSF
jgi:hypothetical protein